VERMLFYSLETVITEILKARKLKSYETIIDTLCFYNSIVLIEITFITLYTNFLRLFWYWNEEQNYFSKLW
jgi:hypothetical protein